MVKSLSVCNLEWALRVSERHWTWAVGSIVLHIIVEYRYVVMQYFTSNSRIPKT